MELKGKFGANYYLNFQMKKEFKEYLKFLKSRDDELNSDDYLFKSQKLGKPYNRVSISRLFQISIKSSISMGQVILVDTCSCLRWLIVVSIFVWFKD